MRIFRSQRDLDRSTNRLLGWFFLAMFILTVVFGTNVAIRRLLGW